MMGRVHSPRGDRISTKLHVVRRGSDCIDPFHCLDVLPLDDIPHNEYSAIYDATPKKRAPAVRQPRGAGVPRDPAHVPGGDALDRRGPPRLGPVGAAVQRPAYPQGCGAGRAAVRADRRADGEPRPRPHAPPRSTRVPRDGREDAGPEGPPGRQCVHHEGRPCGRGTRDAGRAGTPARRHAADRPGAARTGGGPAREHPVRRERTHNGRKRWTSKRISCWSRE